MNKTGLRAIAAVLAVLLLCAMQITVPAAADDMETLQILPGRWTLYADVQEEVGDPQQKVLATLIFEENGAVTLRRVGENGETAWTSEGTWNFDYDPDSLDLVTIVFTSTDNPAHTEGEYRAEYAYGAYTESWVENDTLVTALLLEPALEGAASMFTEIWGYEGAALYREEGPNMKVVNCSEYVSLRKERSKNSARLEKVPLGALVLAFPEAGEENGFILCVYNGQEGYILAEYLEAAE